MHFCNKTFPGKFRELAVTITLLDSSQFKFIYSLAQFYQVGAIVTPILIRMNHVCALRPKKLTWPLATTESTAKIQPNQRGTHRRKCALSKLEFKGWMWACKVCLGLNRSAHLNLLQELYILQLCISPYREIPVNTSKLSHVPFTMQRPQQRIGVWHVADTSNVENVTKFTDVQVICLQGSYLKKFIVTGQW